MNSKKRRLSVVLGFQWEWIVPAATNKLSPACSVSDLLVCRVGQYDLQQGCMRYHAAPFLAGSWFQQHGREVFKRVRRESPAAYLKVCALLVPRQMTLDHSGGVKAMSDEQLERALEVLNELIAQRDAGQNAKVIDGVPEPVPALPPPSRKARRKVRRSDRADSGLAARVVGTDSADGNS
jgi:hypothetical protein